MSNHVINHVPGMIRHANQTINQFGLDSTGVISYQFNQQGFRSTRDFVDPPNYAFFGCSLVFGIGVDQNEIFAERFVNAHNYGLAGHYNNDDVYTVIQSFLDCNYPTICKAVVWTDRNQENIEAYSASLAEKNFVQFFCGPRPKYANCYPMLPKLDLDASKTHMGKRTHQAMHRLLCTIFNQ